MLISKIVDFFGLEKAQEVVGFIIGKGWQKARPVTQQRAYIASNGEIEMDEELLKLSLKCAEIYYKKRNNEIILHGVEHGANASIDCANIGVNDYD